MWQLNQSFPVKAAISVIFPVHDPALCVTCDPPLSWRRPPRPASSGWPWWAGPRTPAGCCPGSARGRGRPQSELWDR